MTVIHWVISNVLEGIRGNVRNQTGTNYNQLVVFCCCWMHETRPEDLLPEQCNQPIFSPSNILILLFFLPFTIRFHYLTSMSGMNTRINTSQIGHIYNTPNTHCCHHSPTIQPHNSQIVLCTLYYTYFGKQAMSKYLYPTQLMNIGYDTYSFFSSMRQILGDIKHSVC